MALQEITLTKKVSLTEDVFELHYDFGREVTMLPGQFITFILPGVGGRSYSVLEILGTTVVLTIKRRDITDGGRGGSVILCDASLGDVFKCVGPAGHFLLSEKPGNKLFLGTGTGLVPLYNQILVGLDKNTGDKYQLVFGVRHMTDMFYRERFEELKKQYPDTFYYHLVVSRDESEGIIQKGYVTDFLSKKVVSQYCEYYLCGAPAMIEGCQKVLDDLNVAEEKVFFEKYT